jgi:cell division protein ZapA
MMPQVMVTIAGKTYRMACDDGQEEHLYALARRLDGIIDGLRTAVGEIGDQRLTVMSAITVLDQLSEAERRVAELQDHAERLEAERDAAVARADDLEGALAERVEAAAGRIEALAGALGRVEGDR